MLTAKRYFKKNSHNGFFKALAGFGRALNRLYENRNHDIYSNGEMTVIKKISRTCPSVIIDGGANVGDYSRLVNSIIPDCKIYAFEPVEATFKKLLLNTKDIVNIVPIKKGLFKDNCFREIKLFQSNEHSSIFDIQGLTNGGGQNGKELIQLIRGDYFLQENSISSVDFLKLDIEGAEFDALHGFSESIKAGKFKAIQFEYGYINITTKNLLIDHYQFFESNGYIVGKIFPKIVEFRKYSFLNEDFIGPNFLAVKASESDLINLLSKK
ncbi:MAG TPA: FkbM family methyltransferase [Bacteroidales bacterium]|nr:FkbM family methyltransferase [Bacteroidales bacterium]